MPKDPDDYWQNGRYKTVTVVEFKKCIEFKDYWCFWFSCGHGTILKNGCSKVTRVCRLCSQEPLIDSTDLN